MAGHRVGAPTDEATERVDVPGPRRADGRRAEGRRSDAPRAGGRRSDRGRPARPARPARGLAPLLAVGLPAVGALLDQLLSSGPGLLFGVLTVLGTAGAALLAGRAGWWWVLTAPPPVVLLSLGATAMLADSSKYQATKDLAVGVGKWAIHGFPVMACAVAAGVLVVLIRVAGEKKRSRRG